MAVKSEQNADSVRHKIVERIVTPWGYSCRCLCGWRESTGSPKGIDRLIDAHIDGYVHSEEDKA